MTNLRKLIDFYFLGRHRLEAIPMLPLGSSVTEAIELFGELLSSEPSHETPEIIQHTFGVGPYHEALACEWKDAIQSITYWSDKSDPPRDLSCMMERYKDGSRWQVIEEGYWYQREDGVLRLWCSAIPAIGVAYTKFLTAQAAYKTAHSLRLLDNLSNVTWAPDDAICELQRQFVEEKNSAVFDFACRSDRIAVSPDGHDVFIVRDHHAYDVGKGFMELNTPPKPDTGYSTQVINFFTYSKDGSSWGKATLPRDANVECIRFEGNQCQLQVRQSTTGLLLCFIGSASAIRGLCGFSISTGAYDDIELWKRLQEEAERFAAANGPRIDGE